MNLHNSCEGQSNMHIYWLIDTSNYNIADRQGKYNWYDYVMMLSPQRKCGHKNQTQH